MATFKYLRADYQLSMASMCFKNAAATAARVPTLYLGRSQEMAKKHAAQWMADGHEAMSNAIGFASR
jgi:hypothetical protein